MPEHIDNELNVKVRSLEKGEESRKPMERHPCRFLYLLSLALRCRSDSREPVLIHLKSAAEKRIFIFEMKVCFPSLQVNEEGPAYVILQDKAFTVEWIVSLLQVSIGLIEIIADNISPERLHDKFSSESIYSCVQTLVHCGSYYEYIDFLKYATTWMHARSLKQDSLPAPPMRNNCYETEIPLLFNGGIRAWLRNRLVSGRRDRAQRLFWSIAQVKRAAEAVPEGFIEKSLKKHRDAMAKRATPPPERLVKSLVKKFDDILDHLTFDNIGRLHEFSMSACWENSTNNGGAKGHLLYEFVRNGHTSNDELLEMQFHPKTGVSERRGFNVSLDMLSSELGDDELCRAKVHPICEPLKVRNITKGNAAPYAFAKGLQLDVHGFMRRMPQFALIGEPLTKDHIDWLIRKDREYCDATGKLISGDDYNQPRKFASGDFSAATDNVKIQLTRAFFERIISRLYHFSGLTRREFDVYRRVLYEHEIHYPTGYGDQLEPVLQQNGQLMGSVLSFFILCAINLCTYWEAVCPEVDDFRNLNVLVNGDDILFRTTQAKYDKWLATLPDTGLTPSPGKNFFHDRYCTVNSQLFSVNERRGNTIEYIPFYNVGMLLGQSKVARLSDEQDKPIQFLLPEILEGAHDKTQAKLRFMSYNAKALKEAAVDDDGFAINWFVPRELGGLGLSTDDDVVFINARDPIPNVSGKIISRLNQRQSKIAAYAKRYWMQPYKRALFKPAGEQVDLDKENREFRDHPDNHEYIRVLAHCPMPPFCREKPSMHHPPNWSMAPMNSCELENLSYKHHKLRLWRKAHDEWGKDLSELGSFKLSEYKFATDRGSHWWRQDMSCQTTDLDYNVDMAAAMISEYWGYMPDFEPATVNWRDDPVEDLTCECVERNPGPFASRCNEVLRTSETDSSMEIFSRADLAMKLITKHLSLIDGYLSDTERFARDCVVQYLNTRNLSTACHLIIQIDVLNIC
jgi:hypothetical protein